MFLLLLFLLKYNINKMANVVDYLNSIQKLTDTNLQILKALNDSFYTKQNHLYAKVDDSTYVIPSFLSLENKINMLQENFENLVNAPETAEAYFATVKKAEFTAVRNHFVEKFLLFAGSYFRIIFFRFLLICLCPVV